MKLPLTIIISSAIALTLGACNKHSWDEEIDGRIPTKKVFEPHGHGGDGHHGGDSDAKHHGKDESGDHPEGKKGETPATH